MIVNKKNYRETGKNSTDVLLYLEHNTLKQSKADKLHTNCHQQVVLGMENKPHDNNPKFLVQYRTI